MNKKKTQNNTLKTSITKKEVKIKENSNDDLMIEKSLQLVRDLNSEIAKVHLAKENIKKKVDILTKRVESQEKQINTTAKNSNSLSLKEDILKEINPLLEKLSFKSVKGDLYKEIGELLELEISKLRSEFDNKNKKSSKDFTKKLSDIELKVIDTIKSNSELKNELKKFENQKFTEIFNEFETKLHSVITNLNTKFISFIKSNENEIDKIKVLVDNQKKYLDNTKKSISLFEKQIKDLGKQDSIDLSSINSKLLKLEQDNVSLKSLLEKHEDVLYNRKEQETLEIEKRVRKLLETTEENFKLLNIAKNEIQKELFLKTKEYFDKEGAKILTSYLKKLEKSSFKNLFEDFNSKFSEFKIQAELELKNSIGELEKNKENIQISLEKVKTNFLEEIKDYIEKLDFELKDLKKERVNFENRFNKISNDFDILKQDNKIFIDSSIKDLSKNIDLKLETVLSDTEKQIAKISLSSENFLKKISIENINDKNKFFEDIEKLKKEFLKHIQKYIENLDKELKLLKKEQLKFNSQKDNHIENIDKKIEFFSNEFEKILSEIKDERNAEKDYLVSKYNKIVEEFENIKNKNDKIIIEYKENFTKEIDRRLTNLLKESKEEISKQVLSNNQYLIRESTKIKEEQRLLSENIENKFITVKNQFEEEFRNHLKSFDEKIAEKEDYFINKLSILEEEKTQTHKELEEFKIEITKLTKEYVKNLDDELQKVKTEELQIEDKKKELIFQIDELTKAKQTQLNDYFEKLQFELKNIIEQEKLLFEKNENSFREVFNEKIGNLELFIKNRLDSIDKKFVEKNIKVVEDKIALESKTIHILSDELKSKSDVIDKKIEMFENKEADFQANILNETDLLKSKVESRLIGLEKQLNKRFLELDSNFTNFKAIIIDEVEDLMKDVNKLVSSKIENIDKSLAKVNFIGNEAANKLSEINSINQKFNLQIRDMRDELNDLRVKIDIMTPEQHSLTDHIHYMKVYEEQLIALIRNLRERGVEENSIASALVNKGHPRFYVKMVLEDYDKLFN